MGGGRPRPQGGGGPGPGGRAAPGVELAAGRARPGRGGSVGWLCWQGAPRPVRWVRGGERGGVGRSWRCLVFAASTARVRERRGERERERQRDRATARQSDSERTGLREGRGGQMRSERGAAQWWRLWRGLGGALAALAGLWRGIGGALHGALRAFGPRRVSKAPSAQGRAGGGSPGGEPRPGPQSGDVGHSLPPWEGPLGVVPALPAPFPRRCVPFAPPAPALPLLAILAGSPNVGGTRQRVPQRHTPECTEGHATLARTRCRDMGAHPMSGCGRAHCANQPRPYPLLPPGCCRAVLCPWLCPWL